MEGRQFTWTDLPPCPWRRGGSACAPHLTSGAFTFISKRMATQSHAPASDEVIVIMLIFKENISSLEWGSLPNCLVTKYVFAVVFTNSAPFPPLFQSPGTPLVYVPMPGFETRCQQNSFLIVAPRGLFPPGQPSSCSEAKFTHL